ncbi:ABC transporter permease [Dyella sp. GSA-30]|uniref:ABC transporter permease n=1 Tax=Dyella sp. GSA-30 TaxID=2994496 RepID=UPI0024909E98|nr:ABC transporter permease [Dyella sp. GSA-30]BDU20332.1 ABC transporter ATP-binding protein [Dyella sp. GSA-30]
MLSYYWSLALHSMWRSKVLTVLMVVAIGLGIGASMTMLTVLHVMSGDPLPGRSHVLFYPHVDPLPLKFSTAADYDPADNMTWPDAMALLKARRATRQAAMAGGEVLVRAPLHGNSPFLIDGRYTTADFFAMFGVPFAAGEGWSADDDAARARLVVLSTSLARKLFGDAGAVGRSVRLDDTDYRVVGVIADWQPEPLFYSDSVSRTFGATDQFFMPLSVAVDLKLAGTGNFSGWGHDEDNTKMVSPTTSWLQFWVQLDSPDAVAAYRQFLVDYSAQQKALGRFEREPSQARLDTLAQRLDHQHLVPGDVRLQLWLALSFLVVCVLNIVALLLAKFLRRSGELSVRRALGARRRDIFLQLGMEALAIGVIGGVLGLLLAQVGLWSVRQRPDDYAQLASMDVSMLAMTFALSIAACLLAGFIPAWRASRVPPALQMKQL